MNHSKYEVVVHSSGATKLDALEAAKKICEFGTMHPAINATIIAHPSCVKGDRIKVAAEYTHKDKAVRFIGIPKLLEVRFPVESVDFVILESILRTNGYSHIVDISEGISQPGIYNRFEIKLAV
jgi:hypothetical protein